MAWASTRGIVAANPASAFAFSAPGGVGSRKAHHCALGAREATTAEENGGHFRERKMRRRCKAARGRNTSATEKDHDDTGKRGSDCKPSASPPNGVSLNVTSKETSHALRSHSALPFRLQLQPPQLRNPTFSSGRKAASSGRTSGAPTSWTTTPASAPAKSRTSAAVTSAKTAIAVPTARSGPSRRWTSESPSSAPQTARCASSRTTATTVVGLSSAPTPAKLEKRPAPFAKLIESGSRVSTRCYSYGHIKQGSALRPNGTPYQLGDCVSSWHADRHDGLELRMLAAPPLRNRG